MIKKQSRHLVLQLPDQNFKLCLPNLPFHPHCPYQTYILGFIVKVILKFTQHCVLYETCLHLCQSQQELKFILFTLYLSTPDDTYYMLVEDGVTLHHVSLFISHGATNVGGLYMFAYLTQEYSYNFPWSMKFWHMQPVIP